MANLTWVLESDVFPDTHPPLRESIRRHGQTLVNWNDSWWSDGFPKSLTTNPVVFHGSLGNAALIADRLNWLPGSFCPVATFDCSAWYGNARDWIVHRDWRIVPATELIANKTTIANSIGATDSIFVRPNSPLKPFSGRVIDVAALTLAKLDHGFYYEDESLLVVAAPVRNIGREWRFVVVSGTVVTGSGYDPATRKPTTVDLGSTASLFATQVADSIPAPANVFVLDVCECDGDLRLLELNPFGGADLYACDPNVIIEAVSHVALNT